MQKHIIAASGGFVLDGDTWKLGPIVRYGLRLTGKERPKICFITTANGDQTGSIQAHIKACEDEPVVASHLQLFQEPNVDDIREHLLSQDMIWVAGGSDVNMLAVWKAHGIDEMLREAWNAGIVLGGISAGSVCWHSGGITDAFGGGLKPITNCLNLIPFSNNVHYDVDPKRRKVYHSAIASGQLPGGYATDDGVALHYIDAKLYKVITDTPNKHAYKVTLVDKSVHESLLESELIV